MKLLFCYDGPIFRDEENNFYGTSLNDQVFQEYKNISNFLTIAIRINEIKKKELENRYSKINKENYNIIECPNISSVKGLIFNKKKCRDILEKQIKEHDKILVRLPSFIGNLAIEIAKKYKKDYLVELVGCPWDAFYNHSLKGKIIAPYMYIKTKLNVRKARYVLYVTEKFLQKRYPTKGISIACSDVIINKIEEKSFEKKMENKKIALATVGAINVKYKGQQYIIKALAKLKKMGYDQYEYYIIGEGDPTYLISIIDKYNMNENIKICGPLPHDKVLEKLDNINVYVQPSKTEGLPRSLIEAMSRGCLCIGSNVGRNT